MLSHGKNIMWVSKYLGHVEVEMVMKTYGRWYPIIQSNQAIARLITGALI